MRKIYSFALLAVALLIVTNLSAQDSITVQQTCHLLGQVKNKNNINNQINIVADGMKKFVRNNMKDLTKEKLIKGIFNAEYNFYRSLKRACTDFVVEIPFNPMYQRVIDIEDKFTPKEIDSISNRIEEIKKQKEVYIFVATIDDYFPNSDIAEFSNHYREIWGDSKHNKNGTIFIVINTARHEMRISTGDISMTYLTDDDCREVMTKMAPCFKTGNYLQGVMTGLNEIEKDI